MDYYIIIPPSQIQHIGDAKKVDDSHSFFLLLSISYDYDKFSRELLYNQHIFLNYLRDWVLNDL